MTSTNGQGHTKGPWEVHWEPNVAGYPTFYIHGFSGEQKRDAQTLDANARLIAAAPDLLEALKAHQLWEKREKEGPLYPFGVTRDTPEGDSIWKAWWNDQLRLCDEATTLTDAALSRVSGEGR